MPRLRGLLLGISIRLGDQDRNDQNGYAVDNHACPMSTRHFLRFMRSTMIIVARGHAVVAQHAFSSYRDLDTGPDAASCGYTPVARRSLRSDQCERLSRLPAYQGRYRAFRATLPGCCKEKSEFCRLRPARRRLMVLFHRRQKGFRRSFSHLLCAEGSGEDRATYRLRGLPRARSSGASPTT